MYILPNSFSYQRCVWFFGCHVDGVEGLLVALEVSQPLFSIVPRVSGQSRTYTHEAAPLKDLRGHFAVHTDRGVKTELKSMKIIFYAEPI